jgi:hypothetical protein
VEPRTNRDWPKALLFHRGVPPLKMMSLPGKWRFAPILAIVVDPASYTLKPRLLPPRDPATPEVLRWKLDVQIRLRNTRRKKMRLDGDLKSHQCFAEIRRRYVGWTLGDLSEVYGLGRPTSYNEEIAGWRTTWDATADLRFPDARSTNG